tara:strand:- start:159 stop:353 length:195 start_codon:yes stop_codon:yes gene_type:complete
MRMLALHLVIWTVWAVFIFTFFSDEHNPDYLRLQFAANVFATIVLGGISSGLIELGRFFGRRGQ